MNKFASKATFWLVFFLFTGALVRAKEIPAKPNPPRLVNDFAGVLNTQEVSGLEKELVAYADSTSNQIAIVIENTLDGEDAFEYSRRLADAWGIGTAENRNGVLLYLAMDDRKVRIQVGYGLEGAIPDAIAKRIIETRIIPAFKQQAYFEGVHNAVTDLMKAAAGEYKAPKKKKGRADPPIGIILIIIVIIILIIIFGSRGGGRKGWNRGFGGPFFGGPFGGGTFSGGGFSGGGFGGGGGGGFGGFGGGSFGGGGAGGSW